MAIHVVPDKVRIIWNEEEIRIVVMASLLLQILLILLAPLRKRMGSQLLAYALWSFYLAADYMATFAVGNILSGQIAFEDNTQSVSLDDELLAFWAPFLLLHLGGPDTITSYSLEDNDLWLRHFLGLAVQVSMVFLVLLYSSFSSRLLLAGTLLVFLAGFIKFAERICALRLASKNLRNQTFLSIPLITSPDDHASEIRETDTRSLTESVMISTAYYFFVSHIQSKLDKKSIYNNERNRSLHFIEECDSEEAFHMAEIEVSFLHDLLHTKASCLRALHGIAWRCGTLVMVMVSFLLFHLSEKQGYKKINVVITYILVCMGVLLEVISVLTMIVSDWTIAFLERKGRKKIARAICNVVRFHCAFRKSKPRWSNQIEQYNLMRIFIKSINTPSIVRRLLCLFNLEDNWNNFWYVNHVEVGAKVKNLIIQTLQLPYHVDHITHGLNTIYKPEHPISESQLLMFRNIYIAAFRSTEGLIQFHIVTELCYNMTNAGEGQDERIVMFKLIGYQLSNYVMNWFGLDSMPIIQSVFVELKESLLGQSITEVEACRQLFIIPLGNGILSRATSKARKLNELDVGLRWRLICMLWVDMLKYQVSRINLESILLRAEPNLTMLVWFLDNHILDKVITNQSSNPLFYHMRMR